MVEFNIPAASGATMAVEQILQTARQICDARGLKLTELRAAVLAAVAQSSRPLGAYSLLTLMYDELGKRLAPPTIYRALDFLLDLGVIVRVESRNAYVLCEHPERPHTSVLFLCDRCESSVTVENPALTKLIEGDAATLGFRLDRPNLEYSGTCGRCVEADHGTTSGGGTPA